MTHVKYLGSNPIQVNTDTQHAQGEIITVQPDQVINVSFKEFFLVNQGLTKADWKIATMAEICAVCSITS